MLIKCNRCDEELTIINQVGHTIEVAPHTCYNMGLSFFDRVCTKCPSLIRCRRDGFECREALASSEQPEVANREVVEGDWQGGHELYIRGDRT